MVGRCNVMCLTFFNEIANCWERIVADTKRDGRRLESSVGNNASNNTGLIVSITSTGINNIYYLLRVNPTTPPMLKRGGKEHSKVCHTSKIKGHNWHVRTTATSKNRGRKIKVRMMGWKKGENGSQPTRTVLGTCTKGVAHVVGIM